MILNLYMTINSQLKEYIEQNITPRYNSFDKAHNLAHVEQVIAQSLELAADMGVDIDMVYTIAAYHDTGLVAGRERHHIVSGEIVVADSRLREFFSDEQIEIMRQAVEDHRASADNAPRSVYGRIIAEADRCIEPMTVIRRTIQYGIDHYPHLSKEEHFVRCCEHLEEKYGYNGYLKLWIDKSDNAQRLEELRQIASDKSALKEIFNTIYTQEQ